MSPSPAETVRGSKKRKRADELPGLAADASRGPGVCACSNRHAGLEEGYVTGIFTDALLCAGY